MFLLSKLYKKKLHHNVGYCDSFSFFLWVNYWFWLIFFIKITDSDFDIQWIQLYLFLFPQCWNTTDTKSQRVAVGKKFQNSCRFFFLPVLPSKANNPSPRIMVTKTCSKNHQTNWSWYEDCILVIFTKARRKAYQLVLEAKEMPNWLPFAFQKKIFSIESSTSPLLRAEHDNPRKQVRMNQLGSTVDPCTIKIIVLSTVI